MTSEAKVGTVVAAPSSSETLSANLLQGMHAAAQPLTILKGSLGMARAGHVNKEEHRQLLESSAIEVERLCTLFGYMQQLLLTESNKPNLCATQIPALLAFVVDGTNLLFKEAGMLLRSQIADIRQPVLIDSSRTHHALSSVLLIAYSVSAAKDTIEIAACSTLDGVRVTMRNPTSYGGSLSAEERLSMALAEANIRSQQGELMYSFQPFRVQIDLRKAPFVH